MNKRSTKIVSLAAAAVLAFGVFAATAYAGSAGSDQDPLVTLSYVEKRIQEVLTSVTVQIEDLKKEIAAQPVSAGGTTGSAVFEVVQVEKGSFIYFGAGTEFVVRSGKAAAIATFNGGLSDLTDGKDIGMGKAVLTNHHMLVPRDDGRGLTIQDISFILIKGPYTITH